MPKTALSKPLPKARLPRNSFPRSFMKNFNQSSGMLIPLFCQFVPLGTKFRLNRSIFMRTAELNTAAFPVIDYNIDFYVVPLRLLMTRYDEFKTNTSDLNSSAFSSNRVPDRMPYFKLSDIQSVITRTGSTDPVDLLGAKTYYGALRLFDLLGYDDRNLSGYYGSGFDIELNAFKLLAYQKVYYDHYRNTAYEPNDPIAYNADQAYMNQGNGRITSSYAIQKMCELHYVNYRKDYFQAVYPGLNYVSIDVENDQGVWQIPNSVMGAYQSINFPLQGQTNYDNNRWQRNNGTTMTPSTTVSTDSTGNNLADDGQRIRHSHTLASGVATVTQDPTSLTNVQAIRAAFAMDKLLRASAYAPKHVKDQLEARYGVKLRQSYGHESTYIGSFNNRITIGEVTSTANTQNFSSTSGDRLGAIGGKGVSGETRGKTISYTCESDSIVIGIGYAIHRSMYDSHRIDNFNLKHLREDLPIPEFMDLGLRPLYQMELVNLGQTTNNNYPIGYVTRDQEYKIGIDENHGLFRENLPLGVFAVHTNSYTRLILGQQGITATAAYFKVAPSDLNSIFFQNFDPSDQTTDQLFGQVSFQFDCRQNMSIHGQPNL